MKWQQQRMCVYVYSCYSQRVSGPRCAWRDVSTWQPTNRQQWTEPTQCDTWTSAASRFYTAIWCVHWRVFNPLMGTGNYSATSNNRKLVHWPFMGGLLRLVQQGGDWARLQLAQSLPRCTKCNSTSVNCRCTNRRQWTTNMEQSASQS